MTPSFRNIINLFEAMKPKLVVAYRLNGKVTVGDVGQTHIDMGRLLPYLYPGQDVSRAEVGFVNHKGHFLNRRQAWVYATENNLVGDHAKSKLNYANPDRPQELDTDDLLKKAKSLSDRDIISDSQISPSIRDIIDLLEKEYIHPDDGFDVKTLDPTLVADLQAKGFDTSEILYHGSDQEFSKFDRRMLRSADHFYTSPDANTASGYGKYVYACFGRQSPQADLQEDWELIGKLADTFAEDYEDALYGDEDLDAFKTNLIEEFKNELQPQLDDGEIDEGEFQDKIDEFEWGIETDPRYKKMLRSKAREYVVNLITSGEAYGTSGRFQNQLISECFGLGYKSVAFIDPSHHDSNGEWLSIVFDTADDIEIVGRLR